MNRRHLISLATVFALGMLAVLPETAQADVVEPPKCWQVTVVNKTETVTGILCCYPNGDTVFHDDRGPTHFSEDACQISERVNRTRIRGSFKMGDSPTNEGTVTFKGTLLVSGSILKAFGTFVRDIGGERKCSIVGSAVPEP